MYRKQLAKTVANAYFSQYVDGNEVMNDPIIVFDSNTRQFEWQSSLTPLQDSEIQVDTLADGMFGDTKDFSEENLAEWLTEENDDYWLSIVEIVEQKK